MASFDSSADTNRGRCLLRIDDLHFAYRRAKPVLRGMELCADAGRVVAVLGPNGCGKTTLLRLILRYLRPSRGTITLDGRRIGAFSSVQLARMLAYVPQQWSMAFGFTVAQTVMMGRCPHMGLFGFESDEDRRLLHEALVQTDVVEFADVPIFELSAGQRQRVMIARALCQQPRLLLLDEPTTSLDVKHQVAVHLLLRQLAAERRMCVVCVTHDINLASQFCDDIVLMAEGRVVAAGSAEDVVTVEALRRVYGAELRVQPDPATGRPVVLLPASKRQINHCRQSDNGQIVV